MWIALNYSTCSESNMRMNHDVGATRAAVVDISAQMDSCVSQQSALLTKISAGKKHDSKRISLLEQDVQSSNTLLNDNQNILLDLQTKLEREAHT